MVIEVKNSVDYFMNIDNQIDCDSVSIVKLLTGENMSYEESERPVISGNKDISISHKDNLFFASVIDKPYLIGVDIENLNQDIDEESFIKFSLNENELIMFEDYCKTSGFSKKQGLIIFWSIKEAVLKCIGYPRLEVLNIQIKSINKNNEVSISFNGDVLNYMNSSKILFKYSKIDIKNDYLYAKCVGFKCV